MSYTTGWFTSRYSNAELATIAADFSQNVNGHTVDLGSAGRCSIVRELEALDSLVAHLPRVQQQAMRQPG